ncbi:MAG: ribosome maturation factor RimP [Lachnospiraceae bacterium]|nr:ribosome maturation factor RimP [Lachnospiraceae bacterium]
MAKHEFVEKKTEELVLPILAERMLQLVDVEYVREAGTWYLRVYIDKDGGVTILDCESVSRALSDALDKDDPTDDAYVLEVSSPGLGRPLKKEKDFVRNQGKPVEIRLYKAVNGVKELTGDLLAWDKETVTVGADGKETVLQRSDISKISEYVEW